MDHDQAAETDFSLEKAAAEIQMSEGANFSEYDSAVVECSDKSFEREVWNWDIVHLTPSKCLE